MKKLLRQFAEDFDGDMGVGAYVNGAKTTPEVMEADERFHQCLDKIFPTFKVTPNSNCEPCTDLKERINRLAYEVVTAYCRETAQRAMRFGAQLMKELLEEGAAQ